MPDNPWREKPPLPADYPLVYLPPSLWDAADAAGYDMRFYAKQQPMPSISRNGKIARKRRYECPVTCMPGLGGACTACPGEE